MNVQWSNQQSNLFLHKSMSGLEHKLEPPVLKRSVGVVPKTARLHAKRRRPEPTYDEEEYMEQDQAGKLLRRSDGEAYETDYSYSTPQKTEEEIQQYYAEREIEAQWARAQHQHDLREAAAQLCSPLSIIPSYRRF